MDGEFIIVALISTMGGLFGLYLVNQNWFKRQEIKYRYQMKRAKLSQKMKVPVKEEKSTMETIGGILPLLKGLDGDQIGALADRFLGGGEELPIEPEGLLGLLDNIPPELIQSFLKGLAKKEGVEPETGNTQDFTPQV